MPDAPPIAAASSRSSSSPRRAFVTRLAALVAAWPVLGNRLVRLEPPGGHDASGGVATPNADVLASLGAAVLPAELGATGTAHAVAEFQRWMDAYRPDAEANHGYGTGRIDRLPADPRPQWQAQLAALESQARRGGGSSFVSLSREQRQAILRGILAAERGEALPSPLGARHVALALLAHFYDSPAATDLCYDAEIGRQQCRPLAAQRQQPVVLGRRGR